VQNQETERRKEVCGMDQKRGSYQRKRLSKKERSSSEEGQQKRKHITRISKGEGSDIQKATRKGRLHTSAGQPGERKTFSQRKLRKTGRGGDSKDRGNCLREA